LFLVVSDLEHAFGPVTVKTVPLPDDCTDGFLSAYWRRPAAYLDARVRGAISTFAKLSNIGPGLERLSADLDSGEWRRKHGELLERTELDIGYRLIVARV